MEPIQQHINRNGSLEFGQCKLSIAFQYFHFIEYLLFV